MQFGTDCSTVYTSSTYQRRVIRLQAFSSQTVQTVARYRCLHESGPFSYQVKNLHTLTLNGSGQIFERRKTCTDPPFVYTGFVETKMVSQFQEIHLHLAYLANCNEREGLMSKECGIILLIALYLFLNLPVIRNEKEASVDHRFIQRENFFFLLALRYNVLNLNSKRHVALLFITV